MAERSATATGADAGPEEYSHPSITSEAPASAKGLRATGAGRLWCSASRTVSDTDTLSFWVEMRKVGAYCGLDDRAVGLQDPYQRAWCRLVGP
jgi:hypothetical protein